MSKTETLMYELAALEAQLKDVAEAIKALPPDIKKVLGIKSVTEERGVWVEKAIEYFRSNFPEMPESEAVIHAWTLYENYAPQGYDPREAARMEVSYWSE